MEWSENDIEYITGHLDVPESLMEKEFVQWLEAEDHRELFEVILNQRAAFFQREDRGHIDPEVEYVRFMKRAGAGKRMIRYWGWSITAASVIILFMLGWFIDGRPVHEEACVPPGIYTGRKTAELILANGQSVHLQREEAEFLEQNGVRITNDTNCRLVYHPDSINGSEGNREQQPVYNTLRVPPGADYVVRLADGTRVRLNCGTEFRYPVTFTGNERKVYLEGEAFFEVEKSSGRPFIVVTDQMDIRVSGTCFNVKSYRTDRIVETTLASGSVEVGSEEWRRPAVRLAPSQQFRLNRDSGKSEVREVDVRLYTAWTEGMFVFKNQRLEEVMDVLARWYSVEMFYTSNSVRDLRISSNLGRYEHIDTLLRIVQAMDKIKIERRGNVVTLGWK